VTYGARPSRDGPLVLVSTQELLGECRHRGHLARGRRPRRWSAEWRPHSRSADALGVAWGPDEAKAQGSAAKISVSAGSSADTPQTTSPWGYKYMVPGANEKVLTSLPATWMLVQST
jgi:hypothetical protein